ncbi:hypothetical protein PT179_01855 [Erysipelothrix rhusiopathiae]|nr:hypothetical protein [Erysipelothrix rhusiopathiae]MDE8303669.1 hypothetical protein [Erysipelothrix rhusiopathiae]MDE9421752.1 hypothetical protein [Erysipelothrix rhusiopathiae]
MEAIIRANAYNYLLKSICNILKISNSGYYKHKVKTWCIDYKTNRVVRIIKYNQKLMEHVVYNTNPKMKGYAVYSENQLDYEIR